MAVMARALSAEPVDGPVAGRGGDPGPRVRGRAGGRPPFDGHGEGVLDRLFGDVDAAEEADQGGHTPAGFGPEDRRNVHGPGRPAYSPWKGRTSTAPLQ